MQKQKLNPEKNESFLTERDSLIALALEVLAKAKNRGAHAAEVGISIGNGFSANVRMNNVETIENSRGRQMGITVFFGKHVGNTSISDFSPSAIDLAIEKACHIATFTQEDLYCGLADAELMAYNYPDLDLFHTWDISVEAAIELAKNCEAEALSQDQRLVNSEGVSINSGDGLHIYCNSHGFVGVNQSTSHSISCSLIAKQGSEMQRMSDYAVSCEELSLAAIAKVAKKSAAETINKLGAKHLSTRECPVIFHADIARGLFSHFVSAISGGSLYRKASFLLDHLGKQVFSPHVFIYEDPHIAKALGSSAFDSEGVRTQSRELVTKGILNGYVLGSYSARKLNMKTTGNAGGIHNLFVHTDSDVSFEGLLKSMGTGLLLTELMGDGVNIITGDYSRGAFGYWVENGAIQYPVEGITIASNLKEMFLRIIAISNDVDDRGVIRTGSVLVERMKVAGI